VLGCRKLIGIVREVNKDAQRFDEHLGFRREHVIEDADPEGGLIIYSLKREDCKFLEKSWVSRVHQIHGNGRRADPVQQGHCRFERQPEPDRPVHAARVEHLPGHGTNPDGTPKYEQTTSLSAPMQGIFNSQVANQQHQQDISTSLLNNVESVFEADRHFRRARLTTSAGQAAQAGRRLRHERGQRRRPDPAQPGRWSNARRDKGRAGRRLQEPDGLPEPAVQEPEQRPDVEAGGAGHHPGLGGMGPRTIGAVAQPNLPAAAGAKLGVRPGLQAGNTAFGMNLSAGQFANSAQQQGFDQAATNAGLANHAADQHTAVSLANAQHGEPARPVQRQPEQRCARAGHDRHVRPYNQPLNTYNQLQTGAQAAQPTFAGVPGANVAPTDVAGIINNGYANQVGAYNGTMQGLGQLGSAAMMAMMV
jgi:hypothetical protein